MELLENERIEFRRCVDRMLRATTQGTRIHGLKLLDVDRFRLVNQVSGFHGGDVYLKQFREILSDSLLEGDRLYYLGEDSFAILCPYRSLKALYAESEALLSSISGQSVDIGSTSHMLSCSIGVAQTEETDRSWEEVTLRAERGLFLAKAAGDGNVRAELSEDGVPVQAPNATTWAKRFHHAFLHNGFSLNFSELDDSDYTLTEVLLNVEGKLESVAELRSELDAMDLLLAMDRWVLGILAEQRTLPEKALVRLSPASVHAVSFRRFLRRLIETRPALASNLWFALSEREFLGDRDRLRNFIDELVVLGCNAAMIDIGASADSLSELPTLPVKVVSPYPQAMQFAPESRKAIVQSFRQIAEAAGKEYLSSPFTL